MKTKLENSGFTLIELLVVIAIIAILAAMLMPVLSVAQAHAKKTQAHLETSEIANAVQQYESDYSHFPVSSAVQASGVQTFTYGGTFNSPTGPQQIGTVLNGSVSTNSDVIAILLDYTNYINGWNNNGGTANANFEKNPKQTVYLPNTHVSGWAFGMAGQPMPGVGNDLVYRDPWGNPYVISVDLNEDNMCQDAFYGMPSVGSSTGAANGSGLVGLNAVTANGIPGSSYSFHGNVMVWSAGPDGQVSTNTTATQGVNNDNVLSWQ